MARSAATSADVVLCSRRVARAAHGSRSIRRGLAVGLGTVSAAAITVGAVTAAAAWVIAIGVGGTAHQARLPLALEAAALPQPGSRLVGMVLAGLPPATAQSTDLVALPSVSAAAGEKTARLDADHATATLASLEGPKGPRLDAKELTTASIPSTPRLAADRSAERANDVASLAARWPDERQFRASRDISSPPAKAVLPQVASAAAAVRVSATFDLLDPAPMTVASLPAAAARVPQPPPNRPAERTSDVKAPPRIRDDPLIKPPHDVALAASRPALQQVASAAPFALQPASFSSLQKDNEPPQRRSTLMPLPGTDEHSAIYDIEAHTVYLPNGERLEAHSGLGEKLDDPHYVNQRDRGPTPPNVYDLALREELFHGVRAIRLNPVGDSKMFGRAGILAHTYMLGPSGQSFGCVSFKDYQEFLHAFLRGDINRLVVVSHLDTRTSSNQRPRRSDDRDAVTTD